MALLNIFDIAGSALTAQSQRLNVAASNLANADSVTGPDGQPYRAKQVVFQVNAAPGAATGGVKVADVIERDFGYELGDHQIRIGEKQIVSAPAYGVEGYIIEILD